MKNRFVYEMLVGLLMLVSVLLYGAAGLVVMVLLAGQPFVGKKKSDERESHLFNVVGNYTAGATLVACVLIYLFTDLEVGGQLIGKNWFGLMLASFLMAHGISGLIIFSKN